MLMESHFTVTVETVGHSLVPCDVLNCHDGACCAAALFDALGKFIGRVYLCAHHYETYPLVGLMAADNEEFEIAINEEFHNF